MFGASTNDRREIGLRKGNDAQTPVCLDGGLLRSPLWSHRLEIATVFHGGELVSTGLASEERDAG